MVDSPDKESIINMEFEMGKTVLQSLNTPH